MLVLDEKMLASAIYHDDLGLLNAVVRLSQILACFFRMNEGTRIYEHDGSYEYVLHDIGFDASVPRATSIDEVGCRESIAYLRMSPNRVASFVCYLNILREELRYRSITILPPHNNLDSFMGCMRCLYGIESDFVVEGFPSPPLWRGFRTLAELVKNHRTYVQSAYDTSSVGWEWTRRDPPPWLYM